MPTTKSNKNEGHRQRLREKFLESGLHGFHDYEIVELLLTLATPRKDCKAAAKAALSKFKSLQGVCEATPTQLCEIKGIGKKNLLGLKLIKAVSDRYLEKRLIEKPLLNNSDALFDYLFHSIRDRYQECFEVIYLDAKNRVLSRECLFKGTLTASAVYPREVVQSALDHHAAALIFAHNHPSGDSEPSKEDIAITRKLIFACQVMDITVHEHLIIGEHSYFSFADQGYISQMNREYEELQW